MIHKPEMSNRINPLLLVPAIFLLLMLIVPLLVTAFVAAFRGEHTLWGALTQVLTRPLYVQVLLNTLWVSCMVTACSVLLGYPTAILLATCSRRTERVLLALLLSSLWLSILIRSYIWTVLLQRDGLLNNSLLHLGVVRGPISLLYSRTSVVLGMTHVLLPYMILSIWTSLKRRHKELELAAYSLGASRGYYFLRILVPLSRSGVAAGVLLVFLLSLGFYITPELLGGGRGETMMAGMLIDQQMNALGDWKLGSVLSLLLVSIVAALAGLAWYLRPVRAVLADLFSHA